MPRIPRSTAPSRSAPPVRRSPVDPRDSSATPVDRFSQPAAPATPPAAAAPSSQGTAVAGIKLQGLELSSVDSGSLRVELPLRKGTFLVPTSHAPARAKVEQPGSVRVELELSRSNGELKVGAIKLAFEPQVVVLNPASSLQPSQGPFAHAWDWIKDVAGDIVLRGLEIGADGQVHLDGTVDRPFPLSDQPLDPQIPPGTFPRLDMSVRSLASGKAIAEPAVPSPNPGTPPTLDALLSSLGAMTGAGHFSMALRTRETVLTANLRGIELSSEKSSVKVAIEGKVELDPSGALKLELPLDADKELVSGAGSIDLSGGGWAKVRSDGKLAGELAVRAEANVSGLTGYVVKERGINVPVAIHGADNILVGSTQVRLNGGEVSLEHGQAKAKIRADLPEGVTIDLEGPKVSLSGGTAATEGDFKFGLSNGKLVVNDGTIDLKISADNAELERNGARVRLAVGADVRLRGSQLALDPNTLRPTGRGTIQVGVRGQGLPGGGQDLGELRYRLEPDGSLALRPANSEVDELVLPLGDLQRPAPFISDPKGPPAGPVGSAEFQERITQLTGAKVTDGNEVLLLPDGAASREARLRLVKTAKSSIELQTFIFKEDESGTEMVKELIAAAKRGVAVKVIIDGLGNVEKPADLSEDKPLYKKLREGGVELEIHSDPRKSALGALLSEVANNPELPQVQDVEEILQDPFKAATLMQQLAKIALGRTQASAQTRDRVAELLRKLSAGEGERAASISSARLSAIAAGDPLTANELLVALRHLSELNFRWHEKYLIVDGQAAITGGMNVADEYMFGGSGRQCHRGGKAAEPWRDADVLLRGPSAAETHRAFARNWEHLTGKSLPAAVPMPVAGSSSKVQFIQQHPRLDGDRHITNLMIESLKALEPGERAYIASAYFLPTGALEAFKIALADAARRGVDVRVVTNSEGSTDMPFLNRAALYSYEELLGAGVKVYERTKENTLHTKAAIFGESVATVGSWNADNRSASLNSEAVAVIYDEKVCAKVESMICEEMDDSCAEQLDLAKVQERIRAAGPINSVAALFGDLM